MKKVSITFIYLGFIFVLAIFLRFYKLDSFPVGFHIDEASLGYNGYSLLKTGKDENNHRFSLYIDMFGDNRPSGYHYLTAVPIAVFGLNEFATRFPGALFGSLTVVALYFLVLTIFSDKKIALLSSFLMAISPWHTEFSRASAEAIVALFFIITGINQILRSLTERKISWIMTGTLLLASSFFFYHSPRVFVPLLLFFIITLSFRKWRTYGAKYIFGIITAFLCLSLLSFILVFLVTGGTGRFGQVNIFGFPETKLAMAEQVREDGTQGVSLFYSRFFHNKLINYSLTYVSNYLDYFSGQFLFMKGGLPVWYKIPNLGLIYLVEFPFIIWGFILLSVQRKTEWKIPLIWLFLGPVTAAITMDDIPNVQRATVMFPMLEIMAAFGFIKLVSNRQPKIRYAIAIVFSLLLLFNLAYFLHQYFVQAGAHQTWYRNNGFKEMVAAVNKSYNSYDKILITKTLGGIYPSVLFFTKFDPATYQILGSPKDRDYGGFGKFMFVPQFCPTNDGDDRFPRGQRVIYVNNGVCKINPLLPQVDIYREDGTKAFIIVYEENT